MFWLEMSKDPVHGGVNWEFSKCVWAPTHKNSPKKNKWLYWENLLHVKKGDFILHLREMNNIMMFVGFSLAKDDGYVTSQKPPQPGQWNYSNDFYRVDLKNYQEILPNIKLENFFSIYKTNLITHYKEQDRPKNLFYTIQSGKLRCLNGAYFTKLNSYLLNLIFSTDNDYFKFLDIKLPNNVIVDAIDALVKKRKGHDKFAKLVKSNYNNQCCFPQCGNNNYDFLIASHIDRWSDNVKCRGDINNGLCFCVFHDKAFENGYFFIDKNYCIEINNKNTGTYVYNKIKSCVGKPIKKGKKPPSLERLKTHKKRHHINT